MNVALFIVDPSYTIVPLVYKC